LIDAVSHLVPNDPILAPFVGTTQIVVTIPFVRTTPVVVSLSNHPSADNVVRGELVEPPFGGRTSRKAQGNRPI